LKCDYLLHVVLGLSAFHLARQHQEIIETSSEQNNLADTSKTEKYLIAGHLHYKAALGSFRRNLVHITPENCHQLFACAMFIFITSIVQSYTSLIHSTSQSESSLVDEESRQSVTKWLFLLRGAKTVVTESFWVRTGPMAPLLRSLEEGGIGTIIGKLDEEFSVFFDKLCVTFAEKSQPSVRDLCIMEIERLRKSFNAMTHGIQASVLFIWPAMIHQDFLILLESNNPEALVVLACYCVLLHKSSWRWWIKGWPANTVHVIDSMIDEKWRSWLGWSLQAVSLEVEETHNRSVLCVSEGPCCQH
jgi:hypothetical protein